MSYLSECPADCLLLIADKIPKDRDLSALARTCLRIHSLLNPYLYRRAVQPRGPTPALWWAIRIGSLMATRYALEAGADFDAKEDDYSADCVVSRALGARHSTRGIWDSRKYFGWTVDPRAVDSLLDEYRCLILLLLDSGANIHGRSRQGWTPLHKAAWLPDEEMVQVLVGRGADITLTSDDGTTPLHLAAFSGNVEVIKFLLEKGADIHAQRKDSGTPLHQAAREGCLDAAAFLLENGAKVDARDGSGQTPLHSVVWSGIVKPIQKIVQLLLDKGADIEAVDGKAMTPLQKAVAFGYSEEVIDCLLANGANVKVIDRDGRDLLQLGWKHHHYKFARRFARRSARIKKRTSQ
ncbi:hypothetical protein N7462_004420 [Penicillium macrosclerotiorum]|uniref:uncharacterized protein n=1 Tax=Penicillium macrosclerotiorum TaxID=303699 RepID=UPI00254827CB|nr:uncharacterized protein N7462_004420 [Penicillium macrosclerotiorum]KAJ5690028.1 hypothetical protein N7462_004420 [Penicillium macrosclerotiorum]